MSTVSRCTYKLTRSGANDRHRGSRRVSPTTMLLSPSLFPSLSPSLSLRRPPPSFVHSLSRECSEGECSWLQFLHELFTKTSCHQGYIPGAPFQVKGERLPARERRRDEELVCLRRRGCDMPWFLSLSLSLSRLPFLLILSTRINIRTVLEFLVNLCCSEYDGRK